MHKRDGGISDHFLYLLIIIEQGDSKMTTFWKVRIDKTLIIEHWCNVIYIYKFTLFVFAAVSTPTLFYIVVFSESSRYHSHLKSCWRWSFLSPRLMDGAGEIEIENPQILISLDIDTIPALWLIHISSGSYAFARVYRETYLLRDPGSPNFRFHETILRRWARIPRVSDGCFQKARVAQARCWAFWMDGTLWVSITTLNKNM